MNDVQLQKIGYDFDKEEKQFRKLEFEFDQKQKQLDDLRNKAGNDARRLAIELGKA